MTEAVHKIRISQRVREFLSMGDVGQALTLVGSGINITREDPSNVSMQTKILVDAIARKDGSVTVELTFDEANSLYAYTAAMTAGAADNATFEDPDARGELVSGRALMAKLENLYGREVAR